MSTDTPARPDAGTTTTLYEDMARIAAQGTDGRSLLELRLTIARALDEIDRLTAERERLVAEVARLRELLTRLREWDHMDAAGDGPFWRSEITRALASAGEEPNDG
jgi:hypothetical protein